VGGGTSELDGVRLTHEPALDGLRGLAVAAVVAFHLGRLPGGFLGVDLFFVLSGFLITSLLADEWRSRRAIDVVRFWERRVRRLLPALCLLLAGVGALIATATPAAERSRFRGDGVFTLLYMGNWHHVNGTASYWDLFSQRSPLDHTWSLAIEEQFYVLWPLVFVAIVQLSLRRRERSWRAGLRHLYVVTGLATVASFALLAVLYDPASTNRAYYGTDTRAGPILVGALLAMHKRLRKQPSPRSRGAHGDAVGLMALAFMVWLATQVTGFDSWYYRGGLLAFAVAALILINVSVGVHTGRVARLLSWRPFQALGRISYGIYLWHWPVIVYLTTERTHLSGLRLDALRVAVTVGVAYASARLIERPIRAGALRGAPARIAALGAVAACALVVIATTTPHPRAEAAARGGLPPSVTDRTAPITVAPLPIGGVSMSKRILVVGDSGPLFLRSGLALAAAGQNTAVIAQGEFNCGVLLPDRVSRLSDGRILRAAPGCSRRLERWKALVKTFQPDVVLYYTAYAGGSGKMLLDRRWVTDCDRHFETYLRRALGHEVDLLSSDGAKVAVATTPYVNWKPAGEADREVDCRNRTYRQVVADHPGSRIVDLSRFVKRVETGGTKLHLDLVHLSPSGATIASKWMLPQLEELARRR
jgi:peptidoglycan/LPS O-acetylase OafA/YrhL